MPQVRLAKTKVVASIAIGLLITALLFAVAPPVRGAADASKLIDPGVRLGSVAIGMDESQVVQTLGRPPSVNPYSSYNSCRSVVTNHICEYKMYHYRSPDMYVTFSGPPGTAVIRITTRDSSFATVAGIRVGSSGRAVLAAYGAGQQFVYDDGSVNINYLSLGMTVCVGAADIVTWLAVEPPGQGAECYK